MSVKGPVTPATADKKVTATVIPQSPAPNQAGPNAQAKTSASPAAQQAVAKTQAAAIKKPLDPIKDALAKMIGWGAGADIRGVSALREALKNSAKVDFNGKLKDFSSKQKVVVLEGIAKVLSGSNWAEINLSDNGITSEELKAFTNNLDKAKITSLNLEKNNLNDALDAAFAAAVVKLQVSTLNLSANDLHNPQAFLSELRGGEFSTLNLSKQKRGLHPESLVVLDSVNIQMLNVAESFKKSTGSDEISKFARVIASLAENNAFVQHLTYTGNLTDFVTAESKGQEIGKNIYRGTVLESIVVEPAIAEKADYKNFIQLPLTKKASEKNQKAIDTVSQSGGMEYVKSLLPSFATSRGTSPTAKRARDPEAKEPAIKRPREDKKGDVSTSAATLQNEETAKKEASPSKKRSWGLF